MFIFKDIFKKEELSKQELEVVWFSGYHLLKVVMQRNTLVSHQRQDLKTPHGARLCKNCMSQDRPACTDWVHAKGEKEHMWNVMPGVLVDLYR